MLGGSLPNSIALDGTVVDDNADVVFLVCADAHDVIDNLETGLARRLPEGRLWLAYRKGNREFTRTHLSAAVDSLDGEWSAIWFQRRTEFQTLNH